MLDGFGLGGLEDISLEELGLEDVSLDGLFGPKSTPVDLSETETAPDLEEEPEVDLSEEDFHVDLDEEPGVDLDTEPVIETLSTIPTPEPEQPYTIQETAGVKKSAYDQLADIDFDFGGDFGFGFGGSYGGTYEGPTAEPEEPVETAFTSAPSEEPKPKSHIVRIEAPETFEEPEAQEHIFIIPNVEEKETTETKTENVFATDATLPSTLCLPEQTQSYSPYWGEKQAIDEFAEDLGFATTDNLFAHMEDLQMDLDVIVATYARKYEEHMEGAFKLKNVKAGEKITQPFADMLHQRFADYKTRSDPMRNYVQASEVKVETQPHTLVLVTPDTEEYTLRDALVTLSEEDAEEETRDKEAEKVEQRALQEMEERIIAHASITEDLFDTYEPTTIDMPEEALLEVDAENTLAEIPESSEEEKPKEKKSKLEDMVAEVRAENAKLRAETEHMKIEMDNLRSGYGIVLEKLREFEYQHITPPKEEEPTTHWYTRAKGFIKTAAAVMVLGIASTTTLALGEYIAKTQLENKQLRASADVAQETYGTIESEVEHMRSEMLRAQEERDTIAKRAVTFAKEAEHYQNAANTQKKAYEARLAQARDIIEERGDRLTQLRSKLEDSKEGMRWKEEEAKSLRTELEVQTQRANAAETQAETSRRAFFNAQRAYQGVTGSSTPLPQDNRAAVRQVFSHPAHYLRSE